MKLKNYILIFVLFFGLLAAKSSLAVNLWVTDPATCPTDAYSQSCVGGLKVCGVNGSNVVSCANTSAFATPTASTVNSGGVNATGGYYLDCYSQDGGTPYCDNNGGSTSGVYACFQKQTCYDAKVVTNCSAGAWATATCNTGTCLPGYRNCNADSDCSDVNEHDGDACTTAGNQPGTYSACVCNAISATLKLNYDSAIGTYLKNSTMASPALSLFSDNSFVIGSTVQPTTTKFSIFGTNVFVNDAAITSATPNAVITKSYLDSALSAYSSSNSLWQLSGSNLFASSTSWNVGIGTNAPSKKLEIYGGDLKISSVSNGYFYSGQDTGGTYWEQVGNSTGNENIRFQSSKIGDVTNYSQFVIDPTSGFSFLTIGTGNGSVGIGTASPSSALDIFSTVHITSGGTIYNTDSSRYLDMTGLLTDSLKISGDIYSTAGELKTDGTGINYMLGSLGIGTNNPSYKLDIESSTSSLPTLAIGIPTGSDSTNIGTLKFQRGTANYAWSGIVGFSTYTDQNGLAFYTSPGGSVAAAERMRIAQGGNVGINTTNPQNKLQINGKVGISTDYTNGLLNFQGDSVTTLISTTRSDNTVPGTISTDGWGSYLFNNKVGIGTTGSLNGATATLYVNGNTGIGTTTPDAKLNVNGTFHVTGQANSVVLDKLIGTGNRIVMADAAGTLYATSSSIASGLPGGTAGQTLRSDGTNWLANSVLYNNGTYIGIGTTVPRATLEVAANDGINASIVAGNVIEVAGLSDVAQGADITITGGTLVSGGPTAKNGKGYWDITTFPSTITFNTRGWWTYAGLSFTAANVHNYPAGGGNKLPANFLVEASADGTNWVTVEDVTSYTSALYYKNNVYSGSGKWIRITATAPQAGETTAKLANVQIFNGQRAGKNPFSLSAEGNAIFLGGSVGIGTNNPTASLDILNKLKMTSGGVIYNTDSSRYLDMTGLLTDSLKISGDIYSTAGEIKTDGAGINYMLGSLGIGTNNPGDKLEVSGNVYANAFNSVGTLARYNGTGGIAIAGLSGSSYAYISAYSDAGGTGKNLALQKDGGNVGIGTTNPGAALEIVKNGGTGGTTMLQLTSNDTWGNGFYINNTSTNGRNWLLYSYGQNSGQAGNFSIYDLTSGASRLTINTAGSVGIGTTIPDAKLNVNGTFHVTGQANSVVLDKLIGTGNRIVMTDAAGTLYATSSSIASGLPSSGTAGNTLYDNGSGWVASSNIYNNGGNVGIGTTNPNGKLQIAGGLLHVGNSTNILSSTSESFEVSPSSGNASYLLNRPTVGDYVSADWITGGNTGTGWSMQMPPNQTYLQFLDRVNSSVRMVLTNTGFVGIGTTSPSAALDIFSKLKLTSGGVIYNTDSSRYLDMTGLLTDSLKISGDIYSTAGEIKTDGAGINYMLGSLGVGTSTPAYKLDVNGQGRFIGSTAAAPALRLGTGTGGIMSSGTNDLALVSNGINVATFVASSATDVRFQINTTNYSTMFGQYEGNWFGAVNPMIMQPLAPATSHDIAITGVQNSPTSGIVIKSSGLVGIGTSTPDAKLNVNGSFHVTGQANSVVLDKLIGTGNRIVMTDAAGTLYATSSSIASGLPDPSTAGATLYSNGSSWLASTNIYNAGGNIGIGTTNTSGAKLEVNGSISFSNTSAYPNSITTTDSALGNFIVQGAMGGNDNWKIFGDGASNAGILHIRTGDDDIEPIYFEQGTNVRMAVGSNGNIGIGTTTASASLDILGKLKMTSGGIIYNTDNSRYLDMTGLLTDSLRVSGDIYSTAGKFKSDSAGINYMLGSLALGGSTTSNGKLEITGTTGNAIFVGSGGDLTISAQISGSNSTLYNDSGTLNVNTPITSSGIISASTGATGGFRTSTYTAGQNLIWAFGNASGYGFSYKQGGTDDIRFHFGDYNNPQFLINSSGNVGINTTTPTEAKLVISAGAGVALKAYGSGVFTGRLQTQTGSDFAEEFVTSKDLETGTVVVMDDNGHKSVKPSSTSYDKTVVGIVSNDPSIIAGRVESKHKAVIAMMGVVKVKVTSVNGSISKGDLLTTSNISGYAMKAKDYKPGTMIGKALENLEGSVGEINVLVNLQ